jgi:CheY-like chemotaxis protein
MNSTRSSPVAKSVLVVDDDTSNLDLLSIILKRGGFKPVVARSGEQALALIAESLPDLVVLDIKMPEMDGFEVCRRLKSQPETAHIPVIFVTAVGYQHELRKVDSSGALGYILKPVRVNNFLDVISKILS